jgi:hypothetical protein
MIDEYNNDEFLETLARLIGCVKGPLVSAAKRIKMMRGAVTMLKQCSFPGVWVGAPSFNPLPYNQNKGMQGQAWRPEGPRQNKIAVYLFAWPQKAIGRTKTTLP